MFNNNSKFLKKIENNCKERKLELAFEYHNSVIPIHQSLTRKEKERKEKKERKTVDQL